MISDVSINSYSCMLRCWDGSQDSRPDFATLVRQLGDFLESGTREVTVSFFVAVRSRFTAIHQHCSQPRNIEAELLDL